MEAARIEPDHPPLTNGLMAHDSRRKTSISSRFSLPIKFPGVPFPSPGVDSSRGDSLETALQNQSLKSKGSTMRQWRLRP